MWANHDWQDIHPAKFAGPRPTLAKGVVSRAAFDRAVDHIIKDYFTQPNYLKIDGEPFFSIYEMMTLIRGLGGPDEAQAALDDFQAKTRAAGFPGLHLNGVVWGVRVLPNERTFANAAAMVAKLGIKSVGSYCWVHHHRTEKSAFPRGSYQAAAESNYQAWQKYQGELAIPYYPNVSMGWDPSARTVQTDRYEARGYPYSAILEGNTPAAFAEGLRRARGFVDQVPVRNKMVTLNAWNEWTEGSFLLPEARYGTGYLEQVRRVFGSSR